MTLTEREKKKYQSGKRERFSFVKWQCQLREGEIRSAHLQKRNSNRWGEADPQISLLWGGLEWHQKVNDARAIMDEKRKGAPGRGVLTLEGISGEGGQQKRGKGLTPSSEDR